MSGNDRDGVAALRRVRPAQERSIRSARSTINYRARLLRGASVLSNGGVVSSCCSSSGSISERICTIWPSSCSSAAREPAGAAAASSAGSVLMLSLLPPPVATASVGAARWALLSRQRRRRPGRTRANGLVGAATEWLLAGSLSRRSPALPLPQLLPSRVGGVVELENPERGDFREDSKRKSFLRPFFTFRSWRS